MWHCTAICGNVARNVVDLVRCSLEVNRIARLVFQQYVINESDDDEITEVVFLLRSYPLSHSRVMYGQSPLWYLDSRSKSQYHIYRSFPWASHRTMTEILVSLEMFLMINQRGTIRNEIFSGKRKIGKSVQFSPNLVFPHNFHPGAGFSLYDVGMACNFSKKIKLGKVRWIYSNTIDIPMPNWNLSFSFSKYHRLKWLLFWKEKLG